GDRFRAAREDDAPRLPHADIVVGDVPGKDFAVDAELAHAARDQLGVLGAEIEDQDARGVDVSLGFHVGSNAVHFCLKIFWRPWLRNGATPTGRPAALRRPGS